MNEITYCVACQNIHTKPVAVAIHDRCPLNPHTRACTDNAYLVHVATGEDAECICGSFREQGDTK